MARIDEIILDIKQNNPSNPHILITDLNLTTKECNQLEAKAKELNATITLLDHHATGENASKNFAWYHLDTSKSATKITYEWLQNKYDFDKENEYAMIVKAINAIDIWLSDDELFEYGKVMLGMISGAKEINRILFANEDRAYKLSLIQKAKEILNTKDAPIALDDAMHSNKKAFFIQNQNDTKDNLVASYITNLLTKQKDRFTIYYKNYKGILGYNVGSASIIGNNTMVANPDYDFYMDINSRGNFSLRSNNKMDVSLMAAEIGNGGGHPNASGGKIENYKDSFVYEEIKEFVQNYIDNIDNLN
jgi:oligoribonuclease NrnB/cAMP/cGMP phosphodiesterase (DHH superfamily)